MATQPNDELTRFHDFVGQQLGSDSSALSPEEVLDLWRAGNPEAKEFRESVQAVQCALDDMDGGDTGESFDEFVNEIRRRRGLGN